MDKTTVSFDFAVAVDTTAGPAFAVLLRAVVLRGTS